VGGPGQGPEKLQPGKPAERYTAHRFIHCIIPDQVPIPENGDCLTRLPKERQGIGFDPENSLLMELVI
jgi:hypothetical protein